MWLGTILVPARKVGHYLDPRMANAKIWMNAFSAWTTVTPSHLVLIQTEVLAANA